MLLKTRSILRNFLPRLGDDRVCAKSAAVLDVALLAREGL